MSEKLHTVKAPKGSAFAGKQVIYALRCCIRQPDGTLRGWHESASKFVWPEKGVATAPDFDPSANCGGGLHYLPWGTGDVGCIKHDDPNVVGMALRVLATEHVDLGDKGKAPRVEVVMVGSIVDAANAVKAAGAPMPVHFGTATAGTRGTATAGDAGTATAGYAGTATAGDWGAICIEWYDSKKQRWRKSVAGVDGKKILPNVAYCLDADGKFVRKDGAK